MTPNLEEILQHAKGMLQKGHNDDAGYF